MAKKDFKRIPSRNLFSSKWPIWGAILIFFGSWFLWQNKMDIPERLLSYIENGDILTLESKYTPDQLMEFHRKDLIGAHNRTYQEPHYKYYPYLLLEVKYLEDKKSREGIILWGMDDGEMVLNTENWDKTHGLKDCLDCQANTNDLKIINTLAHNAGILSVENLQKESHVEREILEAWLDSAKQKHLIVQKGGFVQLHFENPKIPLVPQTRIKQQLVSKPLGNGERVAKQYTRRQIVALAQAVFGNDFSIRNEKEVFLPAYSLEVLNPDGSIHTSEWNALTGQRIFPRYLSN